MVVSKLKLGNNYIDLSNLIFLASDRVVDPIDGTTNFVHGCPTSVVSIGVAHR